MSSAPSQPFDDTFRQEVNAMTQDSGLSDASLHNVAAKQLQVLADPAFANINQPAWVRRVQQFTSVYIAYTSSSLFDALYQTADELGLATGKRYVSATVCLCVTRAVAETTAASLQERRRHVAEALSQLASAWIAHFLWPFFIYGTKTASKVRARDTYYLPSISERTALRSNDNSHLVTKEDLLKRCGYVCFMTEYVYLGAPQELFDDPEPVTIAVHQVTHIFPPPGALRERGMQEDAVITSDILNHYCESPVLVEIGGARLTQPEEETSTLFDARNALVLAPNSCGAFHTFRWCLHPDREVTNQYHVEVYEHCWLGAQYAARPNPVIFADYSHEFPPSGFLDAADVPPSTAVSAPRGVDLPDAGLLRAHAALAGALQLSGAMRAFDEIVASCKMLDAGECVPGASGSEFLRSVVAYEGQEVCADVEMSGITTYPDAE